LPIALLASSSQSAPEAVVIIMQRLGIICQGTRTCNPQRTVGHWLTPWILRQPARDLVQLGRRESTWPANSCSSRPVRQAYTTVFPLGATQNRKPTQALSSEPLAIELQLQNLDPAMFARHSIRLTTDASQLYLSLPCLPIWHRWQSDGRHDGQNKLGRFRRVGGSSRAGTRPATSIEQTGVHKAFTIGHATVGTHH